MTLDANEWKKLMKLSLAVIFPPIYTHARAQIEATTLPALAAASRMRAAAGEVRAVANQLRNGAEHSMAEDMSSSIEELSELM